MAKAKRKKKAQKKSGKRKKATSTGAAPASPDVDLDRLRTAAVDARAQLDEATPCLPPQVSKARQTVRITRGRSFSWLCSPSLRWPIVDVGCFRWVESWRRPR